MSTDIREVLHSVEEPLKNFTVRRVYGEPVETQGKTIVPIAQVGFGFGGGAGRHEKDGEVAEGEESGGGGGGGGFARPYGVLEVTPQETKLIRFADGRRMIGAVALGFLFGMLIANRRHHRHEKEIAA